MYTVLLTILCISIVILFVEAAYVVCNLRSKIHASLLLYILCCLVNNVGYLQEMTAKSSAAAYTATKLLYLGKMNIALVLLIFTLQYCRVKVPRALLLFLCAFHQILYGIVLTNDWHHLYYSSITFEEKGLFPHNVYGHGPVYYVAMLIPYIYMALCLYALIRTYHKLHTREEKNQMLYLLAAPCMSMIGTLIFFSGKTRGFDTGNIGLMFSAILMLVPFFKYQLIDTVDMVKNSLADSMVDGLVAIDAYGELSYFNGVALNLIPTLRSPGIAKELPAIVEKLEEEAATKESLSFGNRSYVVRIQDLYQGNFSRGKVYVLADITDSLRYTKRIEEERDRADRANDAKGQFLANMSHEIRTPINAVLGMDTMILRKSKDPEILKYAGDIRKAGKNLLSIINDILDFSKIESGKMELIPADYDFASMINDIYNMMAPKAREKNLDLELIVDETIPCRFYGDDVRIKQILVNLLTNAIKYTPSGRVTLRIICNHMEDDCSLHFAVEDTGIGIRPEDLHKLTEEFVRIEEKRNRNIEGTGLGINIVVSLLKLMGSKLGIDSVYGRGSNFYFDLKQPVTNSEPIGNFTERINNSIAGNENYEASFYIPDVRILSVDDNPMNLAVFRSLLGDLQCQIDDAESGFECLKMVENEKYDLIFMDHMMPELDGVETLRQMKKLEHNLNADTPVVILTANAIVGAREEYLEQGFHDYLSKPVDADKLEALIGRLIPDEKKLPAEEIKEPRISSDTESDFPELDGVDWEHAMSRLGNKEILIEFVKDFSQAAPGSMKDLVNQYDQLKESQDQEAFSAYRIKVHAMKSNAATIGADHLAGLAKYLEYAARDLDMDRINRLMNVFEDEWNKLQMGIDQAFNDHQTEEWSEDSAEQLDASELTMFLDSLNKAIEKGNLDRADIIMEELKDCAYPPEQKAVLEELQAAVISFDTDRCEELIRRWKEMI